MFHPLTVATAIADLESKGWIAPNIIRAPEVLNRTATMLGVWPVESEYDNSVLITLDTGSTEEKMLLIRGNAGRQALSMLRKHLLPLVVVLRKSVNDEYYWSDNHEA